MLICSGTSVLDENSEWGSAVNGTRPSEWD